MEKYRDLALALFEIKMGYILLCYADDKVPEFQRAKMLNELGIIFNRELKELAKEFLEEHEVSMALRKDIKLFNIHLSEKFTKAKNLKR